MDYAGFDCKRTVPLQSKRTVPLQSFYMVFSIFYFAPSKSKLCEGIDSIVAKVYLIMLMARIGRVFICVID